MSCLSIGMFIFYAFVTSAKNFKKILLVLAQLQYCDNGNTEVQKKIELELSKPSQFEITDFIIL